MAFAITQEQLREEMADVELVDFASEELKVRVRSLILQRLEDYRNEPDRLVRLQVRDEIKELSEKL